MKDSELDKLTIKQLTDLKSRVDNMIAAKHDDERNKLRERFKEMAENAGLTLAEIVGIARPVKGRTGSAKIKVAAKYANPEDRSQTWSGRGRMPNWLSSRVKSGAKAADFKL